MADEIEELSAKPLTEEERYFYERSYKEPVEAIERIEDVAKALVTATAGVAGLFLSAMKLSLGDAPAEGLLWLAPFGCWALGMIALVLVLLPRKYPVGEYEPAAWQRVFLEARNRKFRWLVSGALLFVAGILSGALPLVRWEG